MNDCECIRLGCVEKQNECESRFNQFIHFHGSNNTGAMRIIGLQQVALFASGSLLEVKTTDHVFSFSLLLIRRRWNKSSTIKDSERVLFVVPLKWCWSFVLYMNE